MNTQAKIILPLLFLIASGCVHHPRRGYVYPNEYEYSRNYDSYYNPVYYDRRIYVSEPVVVEGTRQRIHEYQERPRYTNVPSKHQKPTLPRYDNRVYQRSTGKQTKVYVTKQPRYDRRNDSSRQYVDESRSFKQYKKTYKGSVNNSSSGYRQQGTGSSNQYSTSRPYRESKHRKMYNNTSTRKFPMGKSSKR